MRILIDECLPAGLRGTLTAMGHECETVRRAGYGSKKNGELLTLAEGRWDVLLTSDRRIKYQQNMAGRNLSIVPQTFVASGKCSAKFRRADLDNTPASAPSSTSAHAAPARMSVRYFQERRRCGTRVWWHRHSCLCAGYRLCRWRQPRPSRSWASWTGFDFLQPILPCTIQKT